MYAIFCDHEQIFSCSINKPSDETLEQGRNRDHGGFKLLTTVVSGRGNQAYTLATTSTYDEWVRNYYELQVWQTYLKLGTEQQHWAKEVVQRTKK